MVEQSRYQRLCSRLHGKINLAEIKEHIDAVRIGY